MKHLLLISVSLILFGISTEAFAIYNFNMNRRYLETPKTEMEKIIVPNFRYYKYEQEQQQTLIYSKKNISYNELYALAEEVIKQIPNIKETPEIIKLIVETIIAESDGGWYFDTKNLGGLGVAQVNYNTAKFLLNVLKNNKKHVFDAIENYKNENLSLKENLIHNIRYSMAMCISYYYYRVGNSIYKNTSNLNKRANLWKRVYNTEEGVGTPEQYIKRVKNYSY